MFLRRRLAIVNCHHITAAAAMFKLIPDHGGLDETCSDVRGQRYMLGEIFLRKGVAETNLKVDTTKSTFSPSISWSNNFIISK